MNVRSLRLITLVSLGIIAAFLALPRLGAQNGSSENSKIQEGFTIMANAKIPLDLRGKNPSLVGLGAYIVNAQADCNGCHGNPEWAPGGDPFQGQPETISPDGYLMGGAMLFGPVFVPRNLTPNGQGLPAGMTLAQFINTIRTGQDRRPTGAPPDSNLLQVMPWPVFRNMTDRDLEAVYEFLSSIPCKEGNRPGRCNP